MRDQVIKCLLRAKVGDIIHFQYDGEGATYELGIEDMTPLSGLGDVWYDEMDFPRVRFSVKSFDQFEFELETDLQHICPDLGDKINKIVKK